MYKLLVIGKLQSLVLNDNLFKTCKVDYNNEVMGVYNKEIFKLNNAMLKEIED
jgi:hypothetical protein